MKYNSEVIVSKKREARMEVMFRYLEQTQEIIAMFLAEPGTRDTTTCLGYSTTRRFVPVAAFAPPRGFRNTETSIPGRLATIEECGAILYCLKEIYGLDIWWTEKAHQGYPAVRHQKLMAAGITPAPVPLSDGLALPVPFKHREKV